MSQASDSSFTHNVKISFTRSYSDLQDNYSSWKAASVFCRLHKVLNLSDTGSMII